MNTDKTIVAAIILAGFKFDQGTSIAVWCPFCCKYHIHGWSPEFSDNEIQFRGAHCSEEFRVTQTYGVMILPVKKQGRFQPPVFSEPASKLSALSALSG